MKAILQWLFEIRNPIPLYGFFPVLVWYIFLAWVAVYFAPFETFGVRRVHGMVPLTWVLRCIIPRFVWFVLAGLAIWHFDFVKTKAAQLTKYLVQ